MWHRCIRWGRSARPKLQEGVGCVLWWFSSPGRVIKRFTSWVSNRLRSINRIWCFRSMVSRLQRSVVAWKVRKRSSHSKWQTILWYWTWLLPRIIRRPSLRRMCEFLTSSPFSSKRFTSRDSRDSRFRWITAYTPHYTPASLSNIWCWYHH